MASSKPKCLEKGIEWSRFHINVLMIEDSQDDVLLLVREIQQNGYEVNYRQVETAIEMENALDQEKWDIITLTIPCRIFPVWMR